MRIIAGELRGRRIAAPPGGGTRPMLDRVREALFATLGERVPDARVLDLFAGTGSLALEALSRGARRARCVERDPAVVRVLRENVAALGLTERVEIVRADALRPRAWAFREPPAEDGAGGAEADRRVPEVGAGLELVFLDPPYPFFQRADRRRAVLEALERLVREALVPDGVLVLHAPRHAVRRADLPRAGEAAERVYGSTALWYVER